MATDDSVIHFGASMAAVDDGAGRRFIESAHTAGMRMPVWLFDDGSIEYLDIPIRLSARYAGADIAITIPISARSTTSPDAFRFEAAFLRIEADTLDFDNAGGSFSYQGVTVTAPTTVGKVVFPEITFTSSQIDGLVAGEVGLLRLRRDPTHAGDTGAGSGDAELWDSFISAQEQ